MVEYIRRALANGALIDNTSLEGWDLEEAVNAICAVPAADVIDLPLKVGQTVWWIPPESFTWMERRPYECQVVSLMITQNKKEQWTKKCRCAVVDNGRTTSDAHDISFDEVGRSVFYSYEHAASVLRGEV